MGHLMLSRRPDWEDRLHAWIARCHGSAHRWGSLDCMLFGAGASRAVTGFDPGRGHRGKYHSAAGAYRYLKALGFASPEAMADSLLPRIAPALAQRGDLALHQESIGVCMGGFAFFVGEEIVDTYAVSGLIRVPMLDCSAAWKLG